MNELFDKALKGQYAIGQFNVSTNEQLRAAIEVAVELSAPIIIGASESERNHLGDNQIASLVESWQKETSQPIILNADHCHTYESVKRAVDAGFNAIHFDGSMLNFNENIKITKKVVKYARRKDKNIIIEGELGYLRGGSEIHSQKIVIMPSDLTKPEEAKEFYKKTGINNLAIVIGNIHGVEPDNKNPNLNIEKLSEIKSAVPTGKFVLHGGSGTPINDIEKAIKAGIIKININTELRIAFSNALKYYLKNNPGQIKPYNILASTIEATKKVIREKIKLFDSNNKL